MTRKPLGYVQIADLSTAVGLGSVPAGANLVLIDAEAGDIRWRDDGINPTLALGMLILSGSEYEYHGPLTNIKLIGPGIANVSFYKL